MFDRIYFRSVHCNDRNRQHEIDTSEKCRLCFLLSPSASAVSVAVCGEWMSRRGR